MITKTELSPNYTAYYATGQFLENSKKDCQFKIHKDQVFDTEILILAGGTVNKTKNCQEMIFRGNLQENKGAHWVQALVPNCLYNRCCKITEHSGKFIVPVNSNEFEAVWQRFTIAYEEGKLGYGLQYTLRAPRNKYEPLKCNLVTVHLENSFDLDEVMRVAWEIDQLLGNWRNFMYYETDYSIAKTSKYSNNIDITPLYAISANKFLKKPITRSKNRVELDLTTKCSFEFFQYTIRSYLEQQKMQREVCLKIDDYESQE